MSNHDASQKSDVWITRSSSQAALDYWKQQLDGGLPALELSTDRPRSAAQTFREACHSFTLSRLQIEALKALSQREGASVFVTLLATFKVLLHRYTGQTGLIVGAPIANHNRAETEGLIGFFVNTLALRVDLSGNLSRA